MTRLRTAARLPSRLSLTMSARDVRSLQRALTCAHMGLRRCTALQADSVLQVLPVIVDAGEVRLTRCWQGHEDTARCSAQRQAHLGYVIAARFPKYFSMWSFAFFTGVATSTAFSTTCR